MNGDILEPPEISLQEISTAGKCASQCQKNTCTFFLWNSLTLACGLYFSNTTRGSLLLHAIRMLKIGIKKYLHFFTCLSTLSRLCLSTFFTFYFKYLHILPHSSTLSYLAYLFTYLLTYLLTYLTLNFTFSFLMLRLSPETLLTLCCLI